MKEVVVLGGGASGWFSALLVKEAVPNCNVTVIESEQIGILGAGEGATPLVMGIFNYLGISITDLVRHTGATIKNGIKFTNWTGDGSSFYHNFGQNDLNISSNLYTDFDKNFNQNNIYHHLSAINNIDHKDYDYTCLINEEQKVPYIPKELWDDSIDPIYNFHEVATISMHFDARKLADYLKKIAFERGIYRIEGKVVSVNDHKNGNIKSLVLDNGKTVRGDLFFDCSGFARLLIGKHYNAEWHSLEKKLTTKAALPFFLPMEDRENVPTVTETITMKYGWMWKIPLQHRWGSGYVFDSDYINYDEAKQEIEEKLGFEVFPPTKFAFNPGHYKTPWVKNCIAIGLASGFLEPLEATALWTSSYFMQILLGDPSQLFTNDQGPKDEFNNRFYVWSEEISDFLYLHYYGGRKDTPFWQHYHKEENIPEEIKKRFERWKHSLPSVAEYTYATGDRGFSLQNWYEVTRGHGQLDIDKIKQSIKENEWEIYNNEFLHKKAAQKRYAEHSMKHGEMLKLLGGFND
jgi:tryptophan halogenase